MVSDSTWIQIVKRHSWIEAALLGIMSDMILPQVYILGTRVPAEAYLVLTNSSVDPEILAEKLFGRKFTNWEADYALAYICAASMFACRSQGVEISIDPGEMDEELVKDTRFMNHPTTIRNRKYREMAHRLGVKKDASSVWYQAIGTLVYLETHPIQEVGFILSNLLPREFRSKLEIGSPLGGPLLIRYFVEEFFTIQQNSTNFLSHIPPAQES
jgi:hypothetical protein